ncbi:MAG: class I SAM-dependent methyltransferase [Patescibacteria group bacterium]|nr:class I SAM-dependent methyltransferase [Patescibacteria group bacterium]
MAKDFSLQTKDWENDCILTRRNFWLRKRRLQMFGFSSNDRILDLGCGDGLNIQILRLMGMTQITGIDISRPLLETAKKHNPGIRFVLGSVEKLPFTDNSFSVVLIDSVFHHLVHIPKSLREIRRILTQNGVICFVDMHNSWKRDLINMLTLSPVSLAIPFFRGRKKAYLAEQKRITYWLVHEQEFLHLMENEGFNKVFLKEDLFSIVGKYVKK